MGVKAEDPYLEDISDYYIVNQKVTREKDTTLIPVGAIQGVNDVYYIEYQYEIIIKHGKQLQTSINDLWISNSSVDQEILENVFIFEYDYDVVEALGYREHLFRESVSAKRVIVTVTLSMDEPETYEIYQQLVNQQISFEVHFNVS